MTAFRSSLGQCAACDGFLHLGDAVVHQAPVCDAWSAALERSDVRALVLERCTDCGCSELWWYAEHYCRRCAIKGGHGYLARVEIDPDKLLAFLNAHASPDLVRLATEPQGREAFVRRLLKESASD